jgi:hypothetical protein
MERLAEGEMLSAGALVATGERLATGGAASGPKTNLVE